MRKFWTHICREAGETAVLHGEPCNWCNVTEEDIQMYAMVHEPSDITIDPQKEVV
jgi:hypothetical protein|tara:strand:- start:3119 stop:3283 length:165 start_codon:yes stop_codon:yes gene_type:complete